MAKAKAATTKKKTKKKATASAVVTKAPQIEDRALEGNDTEIDDGPLAIEAEIVEDAAYNAASPHEEDLGAQAKVEYSNLPAAVTDGLTTYLHEIRRYPLLTKEQEAEIARRYKESGNPRDAEILVTSNLRFVVKVAAEYARFGARLIDLIQEGNVGLMHAVKEFNPYKGVRLITYAVWWIRGYIQEYLMRQYSMVRIGTTQSQRKLFYRLEKEREKLDHEGIQPTVKLLSSRLGVSEEDVQNMQQRLHGRDVSLDQPVDAGSRSSLMDFEKGDAEHLDDVLGHRESLEILKDGIDRLRGDLNDKELVILEQRLLSDQPKKLQEIGDEWGVTREAVRQMEARLVNKIKKAFEQSISGED